MTKKVEIKESSAEKKDDKVDENLPSSSKLTVKPKAAKAPKADPVPRGVGGQFVQLEGGIRVPASDK